jgi:membrane peptidoglycan carboxypeptidase
VLGALVLIAGIIGYVVWQRPGPPVPPPPQPKDFVVQYADGSKLWSTGDGRLRSMVVKRVLAELAEASISYDQLRASGGVVRTTIDAKAQTRAAAVLGRLVAPQRTVDAAVTAIDPASGSVQVYVPGFGQKDDLAGGVAQKPGAGLAEPFALVGQHGVVKERMTPLDLTAAYATFAAGGVQRRPHLVTTVTAADGSELYRAAETAKPAFGEDVADRITALLKEKPGCDGIACVPGSQPWMVGYTPRLAVAVFVREQDGAAIDADLPRVIWHDFLAELTG